MVGYLAGPEIRLVHEDRPESIQKHRQSLMKTSVWSGADNISITQCRVLCKHGVFKA